MSTHSTASQPINKPDLEQFFSSISLKIETSRPQISKSDLETFFNTVGQKVEQAEEQQRILDKQQATGFNVFSLIEPDENKLSDIIADLLDPRGDHGQGDIFLRLFFKQLGIIQGAKRTKKATVQREAPTHGIQKYKRRIDVLVDSGALVAIENKVDSPEQADQVKDYLDHLDYCTRGRSILSMLIYLTPDGREPDSLSESALEKAKTTEKLHCWSYQRDLCNWLNACAAVCEAQKIKVFLTEFIYYIESKITHGSDNNEEEEDHEE